MASIFRKLLNKKQSNAENRDNADIEKLQLSGNIQDNLNRLKNIMSNSGDIKTREFNLAGSNMKAAVIFIGTLANEDMIHQHIIRPLIMESAILFHKNQVNFEEIKNSMISAGNLKEAAAFDDIVLGIMSGDTLLTIQGFAKGLLIESKEYQGRTVGEPSLEPSVKGPQEAFVEILKINIGLIRRRFRDPNLCIDMHRIGRRAKADLAIVFVKGIVDENLLSNIKRKLDTIDIDGSATTIQLGQMMTERPNSVLPMYQTTERPDKVVSAISEGRVAILLDGAPNTIIAPVTLPMLMQSPDDYFEGWFGATIIRLSRYVALFISALFPALYIAITSFHPGMLPSNLTLSIVRTRSGVPFPVIIEALLMEFVLELLLEAGIRLPRVVGQTVSIVGGLVIGQSAVQAGIVSPIMVIIISVTALSSFSIPSYSLGLVTRIARVPFMILASAFGAFGVSMGLLISLIYLVSLKSFGVSYMKPISTDHPSDWKDSTIRAPLWSMKKRPQMLHPQDIIRLKRRNRSGPNEN
ncbi:MAG: spore germination protein [Syntrophales bacterium]|nr:spore germination protein [Syntrophales bacterium]